jgi:DNA mismatch repair protein MutS2
MTAQGVMNASCEFDIKSLKPTYRLLMGIPGKSNAFDISLRLGLDRGIIEDAKKRLDRGSADFENVRALLQVKRQEMEKDQLEARKLMLEAEANRKKSEELKRYLESERQKAVKTAKREAEQIVQNARKTAEEVFRELGEMRRQAAELENVRQVTKQDRRLTKLNEAESPDVQAEEAVVQDTPQRPVKEGDTVEIIKIGTRAEVISVSPDRILTLQAGIMKITAKENEVRLIEGVQSETRKVIERSEAKLRSMSVSPEVDLRGMTSEEAVSVMEQFLDNAMLAKLNTVTIIHGKGTGALRTAVHNALKRNGSV